MLPISINGDYRNRISLTDTENNFKLRHPYSKTPSLFIRQLQFVTSCHNSAARMGSWLSGLC